MNNEYSLGGDIAGISGSSFDDMVRKTVGAHYLVSLGVIVALVIIIVVLAFKKEKFMPTTLAKQQIVALSGSEAMADNSDVWNKLDCANNKPIGDDAWGWMGAQLGSDTAATDSGMFIHGQQTAVPEKFVKGRKSENDLSAIAQGL